MSWEDMSVESFPCPCGKGTYSVTRRMDDWNRVDSSMQMDCEECRANYVLFSESGYRSGMPHTSRFWVSKQIQAEYAHLCKEAAALRQKAVILKNDRMLPRWKALFEGKNKKQAWSILTDNGARYPALGTFYQHTKSEGLETYLVRHFKNADDRTYAEIVKTIGFVDEEISGLIEQANKLEKDARSLVWSERFPQ